MDVTRENFSAAVDALEALLPTAEFVAIDEEMTGIMLDKSTAPHAGDTLETRYQKMKRVTHEFNLIQVGMCLYHREEGKLVARPFNFYVLPDAKSACARLTMHVSTAEFHKTNGLNFNTWLCQGIPFLSSAEFDALESKLDDDADEAAPASRIELTRPADKQFVANALASIAAWLPGSSEGEGGMYELVLPECNAFLRKALFELLQQQYPELTAESRALPEAPEWKKQLVIVRLSEEERAARKAERRAAKLEKLRERAGFLRVWRLLTAARKPIVGHNLTYDLLFLMSHFHRSPLPSTLAECKATLHELFPAVWDTKLVAMQSGRYADTVLGKLHEALVSSAGVSAVPLAAGFESYEGAERCHEAGYDAYLTGVAHAALVQLGHATAERCNLCYMMRSLSILNLDPAGEDPSTESGLVLHLSFNLLTTTADLMALMQPLVKSATLWAAAGIPAVPAAAAAAAAAVPVDPADSPATAPRAAPPPPAVSIRWIDDHSAFAVLPEGVVMGASEMRLINDQGSSLGMRAQTFGQWRQGQVDLEAPGAGRQGQVDLVAQAAAAPAAAARAPLAVEGAATLSQAPSQAPPPDLREVISASKLAKSPLGRSLKETAEQGASRGAKRSRAEASPAAASSDGEAPRRLLRSGSASKSP
jgi:poly(A)-specific ribonuclease